MGGYQLVPTGSAGLDEALGGGLPERRPVLVVGGPGTGKTTLAVQFLQAGLDRGERCLFVSTEQTGVELRASFDAFDFGFDDENLVVTSVHATAGRTFEDEEERLVLATLEDGELFGNGFSAPYTVGRLREWLQTHAPRDRVVFDSVSGLRAMGDDDAAFRRGVLELVRLFSDEFGATTLLTAEGTSKPSAGDDHGTSLAFTTHGVIRLWREELDGDFHRFLRVDKLRGVDHDTRRFKVVIDEACGVRLVPRRRSLPTAFREHGTFRTGIPGLDGLLGGGLARGDLTLVEHDGKVGVRPLAVALLNRALDAGVPVTLLPPAHLDYESLNHVLWAVDETVDDLLAADRLFVVDPVRPAHDGSRNVFPISGSEDYQVALETIDERSSGERFAWLDVDTLLDAVAPDEVVSVGRAAIAELLTGDDTVVVACNANTPARAVRVFLEDTCRQVLALWQEGDGVEVYKLRKASTATPGHSRVVEYRDAPPHLQLL